jgi:hypothetical protein
MTHIPPSLQASRPLLSSFTAVLVLQACTEAGDVLTSSSSLHSLIRSRFDAEAATGSGTRLWWLQELRRRRRCGRGRWGSRCGCEISPTGPRTPRLDLARATASSAARPRLGAGEIRGHELRRGVGAMTTVGPDRGHPTGTSPWPRHEQKTVGGSREVMQGRGRRSLNRIGRGDDRRIRHRRSQPPRSPNGGSDARPETG